MTVIDDLVIMPELRSGAFYIAHYLEQTKASGAQGMPLNTTTHIA